MKTVKIILNSIIIALFLLTNTAIAEDVDKELQAETYLKPSEFEFPEDPEKFISQQVEQEPLKYTMGPDDVIQIDVRRHLEFSGTYTINSEGKIQYKFVGDIPIAGLNKVELKEKLGDILSKFIIDPEIEVTILEYRSKVIYIVGEVGHPGKYYMMADSVSVREAVVQAGLPTMAAAMRRTQLITPTENSKPKKHNIDLYKLIYEGKLSNDREMKPGDVLYVPATMFAKITRVLHPVAAPVSSANTIRRAGTGSPY